MNVTSWKAKNRNPGIARIHRPWDAVVTVKTRGERQRDERDPPALLAECSPHGLSCTPNCERTPRSGATDRLPREGHPPPRCAADGKVALKLPMPGIIRLRMERA